jgi:two-component system, LytTR family, response regulator
VSAHSAFIVDDEPLARERLRRLLGRFPQIEIAGMFGDPLRALEAIVIAPPDILFLDIQMSPVDGFALLEALDKSKRPAAVVFVTAHDRYALRAFEVNAIDYLLKPVTKPRFEETLSRTLERLTEKDGNAADVDRLLRSLRKEPHVEDRFAAWHNGGFHVVRSVDVDWFEAERNYVRMHVGKMAYSVRSTLRGVERRLDPQRFVRVHRSSILNIERLDRLEPLFHGEYAALLRDGTRLQVSRTYGSQLRRLLGP